MADFLVFQLYGNLASWGDIAVGENRPIQPYPSKSAINGLLGAALGLRRDQDKPHLDLNQYYGMGVCVQTSGELLRDYHTVQMPAGNKGWATRKDELSFDPKALKTILTKRDYLMDAFYLIAIWQKDPKKAPYSLQQLEEALIEPVFTTSLGRKSCPPCLPYAPKINKDKTLKNAFLDYISALHPDTRNDLNLLLKNKEELIAWHWETDLNEQQSGLKQSMVYPRRDQIKSRKRWQFANREEYYCAQRRQDVL